MKPLTIAALAITAGAALWAGCNANPVTFESQSGVLNFEDTVNVAGSEQIDILWVIDNSGSMCQEQKILGDNFQAFIGQLEGTTLDFHIGVTTTQMLENHLPEPVARPGRLQSTPQPVVGYDPTCQQAIDENGETIEGNYQPVRDAIATAVSCGENLDIADFNWTNEEIRCALGEGPGCTLGGDNCGGSCVGQDLFPDPAGYRDIPLVLRSEDYRLADGALDIERLQTDFRCMSLVGTRGYGIEKGLEAAVNAVSLEKTGGPIDVAPDSGIELDPNAPNHGLLRQNSKFGLIFVTDENDCSHDGSLNEGSFCGAAICEFANSTQIPEGESPLLQVENVKDNLLANLRASKGNPDFEESQMIVASIHGRSVRYDGPAITAEQCASEEGFPEPPKACSSLLGQANSGDRYDRFLRQFPVSYPKPDANDNVRGWMCSETFAPALEAIGDIFKPLKAGCIRDRKVFPCDGDNASCPAFSDGTAGVCSAVPNAEGQFFCESGVEVRAQLSNPTAESRESFSSSAYCMEGTFDRVAYPDGCVINRDLYQWSECAPGVPGIRLQWNDEDEALRELSGTDIGIRYAAEVD